MSHQEHQPTDQSPVGEQIPHSGVHGFEKPVTEFDKTTLRDAHEQGLIKTPETPAELHNDQEKKSGLKKVVAGVAGTAVLAVGGFVGVKALGGGENSESSPEQTSSAPANPGGNNEAVTPESSLVESLDFSLPAEKYIDNPELLATDFMKTFNEWENTGYSKAAANDDKRFTMGTLEAYAAFLNKTSDEKIKQDLLVEDWQNNPRLVTWYDTSVRVHNTNTTLALKTEVGVDQEDLEAYKRFLDIVPGSVVVRENSTDKIIVSFETQGRDNSDKNRADELNTGVDPNGESGSWTVTFVSVDGQMKLAHLQ